jgi:hypothetical protein
MPEGDYDGGRLFRGVFFGCLFTAAGFVVIGALCVLALFLT